MGAINENIKNFRTFRGIKQQELADALGKSKSVISNWERGENSPDVESCEKMCKLLNVTPNELFGWSQNRDYELYLKKIQAYNSRICDLKSEIAKLQKELNNLEMTKLREEFFAEHDFSDDDYVFDDEDDDNGKST